MDPVEEGAECCDDEGVVVALDDDAIGDEDDMLGEDCSATQYEWG